MLEGEDLWNTIKKGWDNLPLTTNEHLYSSHHQIVNATVKCNCSDNFVRQQKSLSFGIRKHCISYYVEGADVPSGVEIITEHLDGAEDALDRSRLN